MTKLKESQMKYKKIKKALLKKHNIEKGLTIHCIYEFSVRYSLDNEAKCRDILFTELNFTAKVKKFEKAQKKLLSKFLDVDVRVGCIVMNNQRTEAKVGSPVINTCKIEYFVEGK